MKENFIEFIEALTSKDINPFCHTQVIKEKSNQKQSPEKFFVKKFQFSSSKTPDYFDNISSHITALDAQGLLGYPQICINCMGGGTGVKSFRKSEVSSVRGFVVDIDMQIKSESLSKILDDFHKPTILVESSESKYHLYYLLEKQVSMGQGEYKNFQQYLALKFNEALEALEGQRVDLRGEKKYYTDIGLTALSVKLRTPGFRHRKDKDNIRVVESYVSGNYFTLEQLGMSESAEVVGFIRANGLSEKTREEYELQVQNTGNKLISTFIGGLSGDRNKKLYTYCRQECFGIKGMTYNQALGSCIVDNQSRNDPPLDNEEVEDIVKSAFSDFTATMSKATLEASEKGGYRGQKVLLAQRMERLKAHRKLNIETKETEILGDEEMEFDLSDQNLFSNLLSDTALIGMFLQKFKNKYLSTGEKGLYTYNEETGVWDSGCSSFNEDYRALIKLQRQMTEIGELFIDAKGNFSKSAFDLHFKTMHSVKKLGEIQKALCLETSIYIEPREFNSEPHMLNCLSGQVNLKTGELTKHSPKGLHRASINAHYTGDLERLKPYLDPNNIDWSRSKFTQFILEVMGGNKDMARFLHSILGYTLYQGNEEQRLFFFFGRGGNGKSVLLDFLSVFMGEYMGLVTPEVVAEGGSDVVSLSQLSGLAGKRLCVSSEMNSSKTWNDSVVKRITGDRDIVVKKYHRDPFKIKKTYDVIISGNSKPKVRGSDRGIWRRMLLIHFGVNFDSEDNQDARKPVEELIADFMEEAEEVMYFLVAAAMRYEVHGMVETPQATKDLMFEYKAEQNPFGLFCETCLEDVPNNIEDLKRHGLTVRELLDAYNLIWREAHAGDQIETVANLGRMLIKQGIQGKVVRGEEGDTARRYPVQFTHKALQQIEDKKDSIVTGSVIDIKQLRRKRKGQWR